MEKETRLRLLPQQLLLLPFQSLKLFEPLTWPAVDDANCCMESISCLFHFTRNSEFRNEHEIENKNKTTKGIEKKQFVDSDTSVKFRSLARIRIRIRIGIYIWTWICPSLHRYTSFQTSNLLPNSSFGTERDETLTWLDSFSPFIRPSSFFLSFLFSSSSSLLSRATNSNNFG